MDGSKIFTGSKIMTGFKLFTSSKILTGFTGITLMYKVSLP